MKNNKGITLITLAITIAVLMILATIAIGELTSDNGLLSETRRGIDQQEELTQNEEQYMNELQGTSSENFLGNEANQPAEFVPSIINLKEEAIPNLPLKPSGNVKEVREGKVPIPIGFYYVGGTLNTGVVISDAASDENKGDGHNVVLVGNQFVWIPVEEVKSKIKVQITQSVAGEDVRKWAYGQIEDPEAYFSTGGTEFEGDTIDVMTNGTYTVYVKSKNGQAAFKTIETTKRAGGVNTMYQIQNESKIGQFYDFGTSSNPINPATLEPYTYYLREPGTAMSGYSTDTAAFQLGISGVTTQTGFQTYLQTEFGNMLNSVSKYRGFYIGRYETGDLSQSVVVSKKNNIDISNQSWYTIYKKQREMYVDSSSVVSSMIWGSQWDRVLRWFQEFGGETAAYVTNGTKGNNGVTIGTGSNSEYVVKNIYDMAGNVNEWTMTAISYSSRVTRRTESGKAPNENEAHLENNIADCGTRLQLYIK